MELNALGQDWSSILLLLTMVWGGVRHGIMTSGLAIIFGIFVGLGFLSSSLTGWTPAIFVGEHGFLPSEIFDNDKPSSLTVFGWIILSILLLFIWGDDGDTAAVEKKAPLAEEKAPAVKKKAAETDDDIFRDI
jgi:hypothetical protein